MFMHKFAYLLHKAHTHGSKSHIPKGYSDYTLAKRAEYQFRDLKRAELHYRKAVGSGERVTSAIKDLASLLHQQGRTPEAIELLETHTHCFVQDFQKFQNLYTTLKKQSGTSGKCHISSLKLSGLELSDAAREVHALFKNPVRIQALSFGSEDEDGVPNYYCFLHFNSHSSARKTIEGFTKWNSMRLEWVSKDGEVIGDAHYARQKIEEYRRKNPTFDSMMFDRDPKGFVLSLPVDGKGVQGDSGNYSDEEAELLLGQSLFTAVFVA